MQNSHLRLAVLLFAFGCWTSRAWALDPAKWSKVWNDSNKDELFQIADLTPPIGNIYIKLESDPGNGAKLSMPKDNIILLKNTHYLIYPDTTGKSLAITVAIGSDSERTEINFKRGVFSFGMGDRLTVSPRNYLSGSPVTVNMAGFRNLNGPPLIVIGDLGAGAETVEK